MIALPIYSLIFLAFFVNSLIALHLVPYAFSWSIEVIIAILLLMTMQHKASTGRAIHLFGWPIVFFFLAASFISAALNSTSSFWTLLFLRQCLRFHLLLWILLNLDLPEKLMLRTHKLLIFLFIIQIPTAIIKIFIYGQGEKAIGTYAMTGGGNSTVIPMVAASFIVCYHYIYKKRFVSWILLLGFLAFGLIGEKRASIVLVPLVIAYAMFLCVNYNRNRVLFNKRLIKTIIIFCITVSGIFYGGVRLMSTLNPENKIGGRFSLAYAINYLQQYNRGVSGETGLSYGRLETSIRVYGNLSYRGIKTLLFGFGPGEFLKSSFAGHGIDYYKEQLHLLGITYGITSLNFLALQVGYVGVAIWIVFFVYALLMLRHIAVRETTLTRF